MDPTKEKEIALLSRVVANHLFLGQFEALRAALLSLRKRDPELSADALRSIVAEGGRIDGVLWSSSCSSPSHLAWLSFLELAKYGSAAASVRGVDREVLRLRVEFLLLVQLVYSKVTDRIKTGEILDGAAEVLNDVLDVGFKILRTGFELGEVRDADGVGTLVSDDRLKGLWSVFLDHAEIFHAISNNIQRQVKPPDYGRPEELAISLVAEAQGITSSSSQLLDALAIVQKNIQLAHLDAVAKCLEADDLNRAFSHLRFLHIRYGVNEEKYRKVLQDMAKQALLQSFHYGSAWFESRNRMISMYASALSSNCTQLAQMIQAIQDELLSEEIKIHRVSDDYLIPLPIKKYLETLSLRSNDDMDDKSFSSMAVKSCLIELYHYARISGMHVLECVMDTALSKIKKGQLQDASDVLLLFPLLQPLVAVLGWDILSGKTSLRRRLMQLLWTSKSKSLRLEEFSRYRKQSDEVSCVEHLCDVLCFHLDLAHYVASVNSGRPWDLKNSLLFSQNDEVAESNDEGILDPFVENFVLERLSVQTPMRVLFDVVPGIKFQDAIELLSMQPLSSTSAAWKRMQDIELMHMHYALESVVFALGTMQRCIRDDNGPQFHEAMCYLKEMQNHMEAIKSAPRKIFMVSIVSSLLHLDEAAVDLTESTLSKRFIGSFEQSDYNSSCEGGNKKVVSFISLILEVLRRNLPASIPEIETRLSGVGETTARQVLEWRISYAMHFIEDWEWRLTVLQRLQPLSERQWSWKEALVILRAAPSKLLNVCMKRAKYDIGEEAVQRFSLPPEDKAALELAEWVAGAFGRVLVQDAVTRITDGNSDAIQYFDISSFRSQLGTLAAILLCIDVAATSAKSVDMCKLLLNQARTMLSEIFPGSSPKMGPSYWNQIKDLATISVVKRILQRLQDILEQGKSLTLQEILVEEMTFYLSKEPSRHGQRQRAIVILHQMIDDAHQGKRQFLSGKLHNLAKALIDEDADGNYSIGDLLQFDKKTFVNYEKGSVTGLGLRTLKSSPNSAIAESNLDIAAYEIKDPGKRFLSSVTSKTSTYLSSFIIYIATIGDIVDGVDTTHDFNFFSLVYEWPKDLLTRLVFERGSTDAASKVADIMGVDFVHEVISACVPPVFPPRSGHGWACIPLLPTLSRSSSERKIPFAKRSMPDSLPTVLGNPLYPLQLSLVKDLAKLSPVRAVLACVFGSTILLTGNESSASNTSKTSHTQMHDAERLFYEFALDESERFQTLNRWIQMQSNLHRVSEYAMTSKSDDSKVVIQTEERISLKRFRESESDADSEVDDINILHVTSSSSDIKTPDHMISQSIQDSALSDKYEVESTNFVSLDWENEGPYEKAVERLIDDGKLMNALALSDRCLRDGASDHLLQMLIESEKENSAVTGRSYNYGPQKFGSNSWQYCLRLKDKLLAARLALKYLHKWDLDPAIDVLTMCICHLPQSDPVRAEVLKMRQDLQRFRNILSADDHYNNWQEVEAACKEDPEGLALRLAAKGAVSAALEVAESASLSIDLRRELQGRQLVKLLTTDPLSGGGPAEASRFLSKLRDSDDALPVAIGAMQLLPDLRSKQLLVHFFLKRRVGNLSDAEVDRLNIWALGLRVLALLPLPSQQRCSALHEHPHLILEVLLMMKQLQSASTILKEFPPLRNDNLILKYAAKAISINVNSASRDPRISMSGPRSKQKPKSSTPTRSNFVNSIGNFQREARRAFSWTTRDTSQKTTTTDVHRKRKSSGFMQSGKVVAEAMTGIHEARVTAFSVDGQERLPFVSIAEEWVLTGNSEKDDVVRAAHRYETSPDITLFKALLSLCSDELTSAKGALDLCVSEMKTVLGSQHLPLNASMEIMSRAYHATESYVQGLSFAKSQLRKISGASELSNNLEKVRDADDAYVDTGSSSSSGNQYPDELSELVAQADIWLGRAELLQSLLGSGIIASLDDIADKESSGRLRDRLILDERYSMAVYTCKKCKIDAFPVWSAWGHALVRMEYYAQARVKFKQALQLHKGDPAHVILDIISTMEGAPPVDVSSVRSMYDHLAKSASTILDDSLSADAYLNVLYMPSTFPRSERSRRSQESSNSHPFPSSEIDDDPRSNLDNIRYAECVRYIEEYAPSQMLAFMFRHGRYSDACLLFFPPHSLPSLYNSAVPSASPQRADSLTTDYGTIDDLCELCIAYGAMAVLEDIMSLRIASSGSDDPTVNQYISAALARICNYCETHRHFNYLYKFLVIKGDHVAAGLCCIQLFMNSCSQEEAIKHLENAKVHFEEGLSARHRAASEATRVVSKTVRGKTASEKLSQEGLVKFLTRVTMQIDVVKCLNDADGPQWKYSLFGNPSETETFRRRCLVAETLAEKHFDQAFKVICEFNLRAVDIYAGVAASLAERKKGTQLTEFLKNIKGTIPEDDWDQVLFAAIAVYANKHKERPDRLIDILISPHRKVLACVVCGRLKSAFHIASRSGSVADVEYVAHQASIANALPVVDSCRQWLAQYRFGT